MKKIIIIITCFIGLSGAFAQQREIFHNPVIEADVPDPSMIRVGNYYYLVSTTMHLMPGCPVMRSKDLVHWETISYVFQRLTDLPRYDLKEGTVYGRGQWASSIRYHDGRFYVWFSPNDEPHRGYIYTAEDPAGEWTLVSRPPHHHDASLFFDDDGKVYLFYGTGQLRQLKSDLSDVEPGGIDQKIFERDADEQGLLEGSQAFKHNGRYYVMMISMDWSIPGRLRREVCYRADQITGPYEKKVILETEFQGYGGVGQGCIVDTPDGNWYGFIFQDRGGIGRVPTLMPCRWEDGWPILGDADGRVPECMEMPASGEKCKGSIMGSDDFDTDRLSLNWQWNHNPDNSRWSLKERKGHMRLKASYAESLKTARNTLTQRVQGPSSEATVELDVSGLKDGNVAGFGVFEFPYAYVAVEQTNGEKKIVMCNDGQTIETIDRFEGNKIWIRARVMDVGFRAVFYYSTDGKYFLPIGNELSMGLGLVWTANRFALFNFSKEKAGEDGYADFNWFRFTNK